MNKYSLLIVLFTFLIIVTLVAQSVELATATNISQNVIDSTQNSQSIFNMIGVLFRVLTFQIPSIPVIVNVVVFYPLTIGVMFMIIDVLKDLIPFT